MKYVKTPADLPLGGSMKKKPSLGLFQLHRDLHVSPLRRPAAQDAVWEGDVLRQPPINQKKKSHC